MHVGFVGLGRMGREMCGNLLQAQFDLTVFDVNAASSDGVVESGGRRATNVATVAETADVVILMVLNRDQAEQAIRGKAGYLEGARRGSTLIVMSSLPPDFVEGLGSDLDARGIHLLDAPVSGGVEGARAASLTIMTAGTDAACAMADGVLRAMGKNVVRIGQVPGQGQTLKALNQAMYFTGLAIAAEALVAGSLAGIDPDIMVEVISKSSGDNWALRNRAPLAWKNNYKSGGSLAVANKDLAAAARIFERLGVTASVATATTRLYSVAAENGPADADDPEAVRAVERLANHQLGSERKISKLPQ